MFELMPLQNENSVAQPARRRASTFVVVLAVHIGLIALLVVSGQAVEHDRQQGSLSVFSLAAAAPMERFVPVAVPMIPAENEPANPSPEVIFAEQQGVVGDPDGEPCSPVEVVTAQLSSDPLVPAAIGQVSRDDRSISEAIVMWNAEWSPAAAGDDAPLAEVRDLVLLTLADLPPDCLAMPVVGPRLIPIAEDNGSTTFLAFGSGEWSWQQLAEPEDDFAAEDKSWTWSDLIGGNSLPVF